MATQTNQSKNLTPASPANHAQANHESIAKLAYEKWIRRGCPHGTDQQDWLEAEAELQSRNRAGQSQNQAPTQGKPATSRR